MADEDLRRLEREAARGDEGARARLERARSRAGLGDDEAHALGRALGLLGHLMLGGLPLVRGLLLVALEVDEPLGRPLREVALQLDRGATVHEAFGAALERLPAWLPPLIRAGEETGSLDEVLLQAHRHLADPWPRRVCPAEPLDAEVERLLAATAHRVRVGFAPARALQLSLGLLETPAVEEPLRTLAGALAAGALPEVALGRGQLPAPVGLMAVRVLSALPPHDWAGDLLARAADALREGLLGCAAPPDRAAALQLGWALMGFLLQAGVPTDEAAGALAELPALGGEVRRGFQAVREALRCGEPLAEGLRQQPGLFAPSACELIGLAERAGSLERACFQLAAGLQLGLFLVRDGLT